MPDFDERRASREFDKNPPSSAPGMSDDGWGSLFDSPSGGDSFDSLNSGGLGGDVDSILNNSGFGGQSVGTSTPGIGFPNNNQNTPNNQDKPIEDKIFDISAKGIKGLYEFLKALVESLRNNSSEDWHKLGVRYFKLSLACLIIGCVIGFIGLFVRSISGASNLVIGGALSMAVSIFIVFTTSSNNSQPKTEVAESLSEETNFDSNENSFGGDDSDFSFGDDDNNSSFESFGDEDDNIVYEDGEDDGDDDIWDGILNDDSPSLFTPANSADGENFSVEDAVNNLDDVGAGKYTRQYLFETFEKILPVINPTFGDMEELPEGSDEFLEFEEMLQQSAAQTGVNEEKMPYLNHVRKNLFVIQLEATRPTGLKEEEIANGVAQLYQMGGADGYSILDDREGVYATVASVVGKLIINIFLGKPAMVSLGAVFQKKKEFLLDPKCTMPLIWGINELGKVLCYDGMKAGNGGMLISGESRSGKSWKGQSLIAQMCMFMSPKELNFYFFDVKGTKSDYYYLSRHLPHAKGFYNDPLQFTTNLKKILDREVAYRERLLGEEYVNVKDYNKDHPFEKIPTVYIVVDEMAAAMKAMDSKDKEIHKDFDAQMIAIATKYPYLEIKLLVFPHRIVNDIISKTVSSMISCRSVMGSMNFEELKSSLDIPNKKAFPYNLVSQGDMAIRTKDLSNGNAVYCHAEVLSSDESVNRKIFDYIGAVWQKLEPDCGLMPSLNSTSGSNKTAKPVKDNSFSKVNMGNSKEVQTVDIFDEMEDTTVDESFWGEIINEDEGTSDINERVNKEVSEENTAVDDFWDE